MKQVPNIPNVKEGFPNVRIATFGLSYNSRMTSGFLYAIAAAVTWGLVYAIYQQVLKGFSPFTLVLVNAALTVILLLPIVIVRRDFLTPLFRISTKTWILAIIALALAALANFLIYSSIQILGASTASIFEIAYPFFVVLFAYLLFRTSLNIYFFLGAILIFAGSVVIITLA